MSDASEVKRWSLSRLERLSSNSWENPTFVSSQDHDRIVADLRIKIRSLNLEIETRAKPTVEKLKNEITNLKAEVEVLKNHRAEYEADCKRIEYFNDLHDKAARQAKVIEKLKRYTQHRVDCIYRTGVFQYSNDCDCGLKAIEKEAEA